MKSFHLGCVLGLLSCVSAAVPAEVPLDLGKVREEHVMIPMRDGVRLSAHLYFPDGQGPWPAVFEQRYADVRGASTRKWLAGVAAKGYAVAIINFRGTHESEGKWVGYRALGWGQQQDGFDTCEWLASQPWCTGKVGTFGSSQGGYAQNFLAVTQPPHLVCQFMVDTGLSLYHEGYCIGGAFRPDRHSKLGDTCRNPEDNKELMAEWFAHPAYDSYWRQEDCTKEFARMNVPCMTLGSWFDFMNTGSIKSWAGRDSKGGASSRGQQWLVIGPWLHGRSNKGNKVGELVYPENAAFDDTGEMIRWFDFWLKGIDNGVTKEPHIRYYQMGGAGESGPGNAWKTASTWPVKSYPRNYYFVEGGKLDTKSPTAAKSSTSYVSDPKNPARIPTTSFPGARDARAFESQPGVITFTTQPLTEPVEWTGLVNVELAASSTAKDTDFIVRVSDVYPDGRSILLIDSIRRARFRDGFDHETFLKPDRTYKIAFEVGWLSQIFNKGHSIRVTVASMGAQFYEPNPQTGEKPSFTLPQHSVTATNTIHHSRTEVSRIIAPIPDVSSGIGITRLRGTRPQSNTRNQPPGAQSQQPPVPPQAVP